MTGTKKAVGHGERMELYIVAKKLRGKFQLAGKLVKDINDNPLSTSEKHLNT